MRACTGQCGGHDHSRDPPEATTAEATTAGTPPGPPHPTKPSAPHGRTPALAPSAARLRQAPAASFRKDLLKHREQKPGHTEYEVNAGALLTAAVNLQQEATTAA